MRSWFEPPRRSAIGIDVAGRFLHAVQLRRTGAEWSLEAAASYPRGDDTTLKVVELRSLMDMMDRQGFRGHDVALAIPSDRVMSDMLELPPLRAGVSTTQLTRMEVARTHKCSPDAFELSAWSLPPTGRQVDTNSVMVHACRHEDSNEWLSVWDEAGLDCTVLDAPGAAIARALQGTCVEHGVVAALQFEWDACHLVILHSGVMIYERAIAEGALKQLHAILMDRLGLDGDVADFALFEVGLSTESHNERRDWPLLTDARGIFATHFTSVLDEARASLTYANHCYPDAPVQRMYLLGRGASIPGLAAPIAATLELETMPICPAQLIKCPQALLVPGGDPSLTLALGLALFEDDHE